MAACAGVCECVEPTQEAQPVEEAPVEEKPAWKPVETAPAEPIGAPKFDPNTGQPIGAPAPKFDPNTGQPIGAPAPIIVAMQPQVQTGVVVAQPGPPPPPGRWSSGPFECFSDCCTCMSGWCCPCVLLGQLYEKNGSPGACIKIVGGVVFLEVLMYIFAMVFPPLVSLIRTIEWAICFVLAWQVRSKIQARDGIQGDQCQDCLCTWFCFHCNLCMMGRHEYPVVAQVPTYQFTTANGLADSKV